MQEKLNILDDYLEMKSKNRNLSERVMAWALNLSSEKIRNWMRKHKPEEFGKI